MHSNIMATNDLIKDDVEIHMSSIQPHYTGLEVATDSDPTLHNPVEEEYPADPDDDQSVFAQPIVLRHETRRDLSWIDVASLIINKMVGTGIFTGPFAVLKATNDKRIAILLWVIGFLYTILSMSVYLEYARDLPYTGGELVYIDELFASRHFPLLGYTLYATYFIFLYTTTTNSLQFAQQIVMAASKDYDPESIEGKQPLLRFIAVVITTAICMLLYFSSSKSQLANRVTAFAKVGLLLAVVVGGIVYSAKLPKTYSDWSKPAGAKTNWTEGLLTILFSYHGWENATLVAGEIPRFKTLRNGFIVAVMIVSISYITIAVTLCYAFPWSSPDQEVPFNYMALYFGNSDRAKVAAAVLTSLSAVGSMISVAYTATRVKHIIGWPNILPWSRFWRMSSPVRIAWWRAGAMMQRTPDNQPTQLLTIPRGTPEGGVLLSWIMTVGWICVSSVFKKYSSAIGFTSDFLIYGHFFASGAIGWGFFAGAFKIGPYFVHNPERRGPTPGWNSERPWELLFPRSRPWLGHVLLGGPLFAISGVVIVAGLTYRDGRTYFYVIAAMLVIATIYWAIFINVPIADRVLRLFGLSISKATHGIDDRDDSERVCDKCPNADEPAFEHRHAHDGYITYNSIRQVNSTGRDNFWMLAFGGVGEHWYNPAARSAATGEGIRHRSYTEEVA